MKKLLYLVHRLPYPPNKGDKISSYNMMNFFSKNWRIHLATFIDDPEDQKFIATVQGYCEDSCIVDLPSSKKLTGSLQGLIAGEALSLSYYKNKKLANWVKKNILQEKPDAILVFSGAMGQFIEGIVPSDIPVIFDAEDVDSEKWKGYASSKSWPLSWLYKRESRKLLEYERKMAKQSGISLFVSKEEAELFKELAPESANKIEYRTQGVDSLYFNYDEPLENPYKSSDKALVFTGVMDYWPNIEAVDWFCKHVFPRLKQQVPEVQFYIVGMKPTKDVLALSKIDGVIVTGGVPDVRPYLKYAHASCLPLQLARGIQNKALEAMSIRLPVLATTAALTGIINYQETNCYVSDDVEGFIEKAKEVLSQPRQMNDAGRDCVLKHYNWDTNLQKMESFMMGEH